MFLPLGFGGRSPRFPTVTSSLCIGIFIAHLYFGRNAHTHWLMLSGNLIILFFLGSLVEGRRSAWIMLSTFFFGGGFGYLLQASLQRQYGGPVMVEASAGIAAVAGLFSAFFFRFRMKFVFFVVPPFYKTFHASSLVILPLIFFATDLLNGTDSDVSPNLGYVAQLGGAIIGLLVGLAIEGMRPIRWPLLYGFEEAEITRIRREPNAHQRIHGALDLLGHNPENVLASEIVCKETLLLIESGFPVTPEFQDLLRQHVPTLMSVYTRQNDSDQAFFLLPRIPIQVSFPQILDRSSQPVIAAAMKWAQARNDVWTLLRLYETWAMRVTHPRRRIAIHDNVTKIIAALDKTPDNYRRLSLLYSVDVHGALAETYQQSLKRIYDALSEQEVRDKKVA